MNLRISSLPRFNPETPGVVPGTSQLTLSERFAKAVFISPFPNAAHVCVTKDFFSSLVMIVLLRREPLLKYAGSHAFSSYRLNKPTYQPVAHFNSAASCCF